MSSTQAPAFSILDELLGDQRANDEPGATSFIRSLLEVIAHEAIDAKTDVLTGFSLVKTAAQKNEAIERLILSINEDMLDEAAWNIFDQYVRDIESLET